MDKEKAWLVVKPHLKCLLADLVVEILKPALEEAVKKSETPIDDTILAVLEAPLLAALKEQIEHI